VGFAPGEELLPGGPHSHSGYGLLHEYFAFPAKFAFFDVDGLENAAKGKRLDILFLLNRPPAQRLSIDSETFALGCTPIVNLFPKIAEPVRLDHKTTEYRVVPDQRREATTEVHSILRVASQRDSDEDSVAFQPFFSFDHAGGANRAFWASRVQPVPRADIPGSETLISLVDLDFNPVDPGVQSIFVRTLCTNRHLAEQLPTGAVLQCELAAPIAEIVTLQRPTSQRDTPLGGGNHWKLVSHLTLNHLSIEGPEGMRALREMLKLYAGDDAMALRQIAGVREISSRRVTRRVGTDAWRGFCRGVQISVTLDETDFVGGNPYLFGAVLSRFFAQHAAVNSFTQLRLYSAQREGIWKEWPPATGTQIVA
jgi:type VI secretion system protein ImpG